MPTAALAALLLICAAGPEPVDTATDRPTLESVEAQLRAALPVGTTEEQVNAWLIDRGCRCELRDGPAGYVIFATPGLPISGITLPAAPVCFALVIDQHGRLKRVEVSSLAPPRKAVCVQ